MEYKIRLLFSVDIYIEDIFTYNTRIPIFLTHSYDFGLDTIFLTDSTYVIYYFSIFYIQSYRSNRSKNIPIIHQFFLQRKYIE